LRGQYVISRDRLVPQEQGLLGGAYSVRGYPDSVLSADDSLVTTVEYTFDAGRLLPRGPVVPADLDLFLRAFMDYGYRWVTPVPGAAGSARLAERDMALWSAGVGTELGLWKKVSLRCDVGYVLRDIEDAFNTLAEKGDVRGHFMGSVSW
jgi:hemolysin activation/secretion protein